MDNPDSVKINHHQCHKDGGGGKLIDFEKLRQDEEARLTYT